MDLTSRQQNELHIAVYEYLRCREVFKPAAQLLLESSNAVLRFLMTEDIRGVETTSLLEKKWRTVIRLQNKNIALENRASQSTSQVERSDERHNLDVAVFFYLKNKPDFGSQKACAYMLAADSSLAGGDYFGNNLNLQNCWTQIPTRQKKMYELDAMPGKEIKPDEFSTGNVLQDLMERSLAYSQTELLSTFDALKENENDDEHRSATNEDGALLGEDKCSNMNRRISRQVMCYDLPAQDTMLSAIQVSGRDEVQKALSQQDPYCLQPDNSIYEGQRNMVTTRATAVANGMNLHKHEGPHYLKAGISVAHGIQGDSEEFDETIVPNESYKSLDEELTHLHRGLEELDDQANEHTDKSLPSLLSHHHEEKQTKHCVSDPFAIRKGNTLSWKNMSMTVVSVSSLKY